MSSRHNMKKRIAMYIATLLNENGLPDDAVERARRFFTRPGSIDELLALPLSPDGVLEATGVLQWTLPDSATRTEEPAPTLSAPTRHMLLDIYQDDNGRNGSNYSGSGLSEAALFLLARDIEARAFNRARSGGGPSDEGERSEGS